MALRGNTLVAEYDFVSKADEAIDRSGEDFEQKWKQYRDGVGDCPLIPGARPAVFRLRHLGSVERMYLGSAEGGHELLLTAASLALVDAKGLGDAEGKPLQFRKDSFRFGTQRITHAHADVLAAIPLETLAEIGALVMERIAPRPS